MYSEAAFIIHTTALTTVYSVVVVVVIVVVYKIHGNERQS